MPLVKLQIAPGIQADNTRYVQAGSWAWSKGDMVRFRGGFPEQIGGWQKINEATFLGTCRNLWAWTSLAGDYYLGVGTHLKYYIESGGSYYDITPLRYTVVLNNPFDTTNTLPTVNVNATAHGAVEGDFVTFSGGDPVGGLDLDFEYQITSVTGPDDFIITASSNATSTVTGGGGATVTAKFQLSIGLDTAVYGNGWGAGLWGGVVIGGTDTGWGEAATVTVGIGSLRLWSSDNYGQDLIINPRDGGIYYWVQSTGLGVRAVNLSTLGGAADVPTEARQIISSTKDEKVIAFGATDILTGLQDRLLIRWSDSGVPQMWTPLETNSAGGFRIPHGSEFITAVETKTEILVWTDNALHSMQYIGAPLEYGIERIGFTSIASPNAVIAVNDAVYWMSSNSFQLYDGRIVSLPSSVNDYVFNNINLLQAEKISACSNAAFNEVWWFYPSLNSENNDSMVGYNYLEKVWFIGSIERTAWIDSGIEDYPRAASRDGYIYFHEFGQDDGSTNPPTALASYVESGILEIGQGDKFGFVWRMIPDITFRNSAATSPKVTITLKAQEFNGTDFNQTAPETTTRTATIPIEQFTKQTYFRLRGREITMRVENNDLGVAWRLGVPRIDVRPDGGR